MNYDFNMSVSLFQSAVNASAFPVGFPPLSAPDVCDCDDYYSYVYSWNCLFLDVTIEVQFKKGVVGLMTGLTIFGCFFTP